MKTPLRNLDLITATHNLNVVCLIQNITCQGLINITIKVNTRAAHKKVCVAKLQAAIKSTSVLKLTDCGQSIQ